MKHTHQTHPSAPSVADGLVDTIPSLSGIQSKLISVRTKEFKKQMGHLPKEIQECAKMQFEHWRADPQSLETKLIENGKEKDREVRHRMFRVRLHHHYRAIGVIEQLHPEQIGLPSYEAQIGQNGSKSKALKSISLVVWVWAGNHGDFDKVLGRGKDALDKSVKVQKASIIERLKRHNEAKVLASVDQDQGTNGQCPKAIQLHL